MKKFLIIGNGNAVKYKDIFPLIKENKIWLGVRLWTSSMYFIYNKNTFNAFNGTTNKIIDGVPMVGIMSCVLYTNLIYDNADDDIVLSKIYVPEKYQHYDNYDAINVDKLVDIPVDYDGVMGVPITFLDKYSPEQFEILGCSAYSDTQKFGVGSLYVNNKKNYARILIRKKN